MIFLLMKISSVHLNLKSTFFERNFDNMWDTSKTQTLKILRILPVVIILGFRSQPW